MGRRHALQIFTSHPEPELGEATAEGRIGEFAEHGWDADVVPDPQDPETFTRSKLDWSELSQEPHDRLLAVHSALLALRRAHPDLVDPDLDGRAVELGRRRPLAGRAPRLAAVVVNLADAAPRDRPGPPAARSSSPPASCRSWTART